MAEVKIFELGLKADQYIETAKQVKSEIDKLTESQKQLKTDGETATSQYIEQEVALKELKAQYNGLTKAMRAQSVADKETAELKKTVNSELAKEVNTINEANLQTTRLNKIKKNLNVNNREEKALLDQINKRIDANTDFVKNNSSAMEKQKMNIGNYQSALQGLSPGMANFVSSGQRIVTGLKAQKVALQATNSSLKAFRIALLATGIGAIVVALGLLVKAFLSTQKGIDAVNSVLTPLKVVMQSLIGVAERLGEKLVDSFKNPKKLLVDLLNYLKDNVMNRFTAFSVILDGIVNMDMGKVTDGVLQAATGVEDMTNKIKNATSETNKFLDEAWQRGKRIAELDIEIAEAKKRQNLEVAVLNRALKQQELISKDTTKSAEERARAVDAAAAITKRKNELEKEILSLQIEQTKEKQKSNDTDREAQQELLDLKAKQIDLDTKQQKEDMRFLGTKNSLAKQASKEAIDALKKEHEEVLKNMQIEIDTYIEKNKTLLESDAELNDRTYTAKLRLMAQLNNLEKQRLEKKIKYENIADNEANLMRLQLENDYQAKVTELKKSFKDKQIADQMQADEEERQRRLLELDLELQEIEFSEQSKTDKKMQMLELEKEKEIELLNAAFEKEEIDSETHERKLALINKKYRKEEEKINSELEKTKIKIKQKEFDNDVKMARDTAAIATAVFGKNKEISAAMTLVDTYVAAQKAYTSQLVPGDPSSVVRATIAAAAAVASGLANVANIYKVSDKGGGGSGTSTSTPSFNRPTSSAQPIQSQTSTPQPTNVVNDANQQDNTVRVINVARDTADVYNNELYVENYANH